MISQKSRKQVYGNAWIKVFEDEVVFENGHEGIFGVVKARDFSVVIAIRGDRVMMVRQYRYASGVDSWEFPMGAAMGDGKKPEEVARMELKEETGLEAKRWRHLSTLQTAHGFVDQKFHVFEARGLNEGVRELEITEGGLERKWLEVSKVKEMIERGEIVDSPTVSAYCLWMMKRGESDE